LADAASGASMTWTIPGSLPVHATHVATTTPAAAVRCFVMTTKDAGAKPASRLVVFTDRARRPAQTKTVLAFRAVRNGTGAALACAGLSGWFFLTSACGTRVVEHVNAPVDAGASVGFDGASSPIGSSGEAGAFDATVGIDGPSGPGPDAGGPFGSDGDSGVATCPGQGTTSVSGTVYDPAGANPVPHAFVFVPTDPASLPAIAQGAASCGTCDVPLGSYVTATVTDATGSFSLKGVPTGANVPVVIQLGKWHRELAVTTTSCQDTAFAAGVARLPRNHGEGDMPQMALLTGGLDDLGCLLVRIGIDPQEFSAPHAGGRLDVYRGLSSSGLSGLGAATGAPGLSSGTPGDCTNASCPLWSSKTSLEAYDIVLLACEGDTFDPSATPDGGISFGNGGSNVTTAAKQNMHAWLGEGGKVFATHFHYTWFANGPADFKGLATWLGSSVGNATGTLDVVTTFPKGQDLFTELADAGALGSGSGLAVSGISASVGTVNGPARAWLVDPSNGDPKHLTFATPVGGTCGKVAFTDLHAGGAPTGDIPTSCTARALTAQEKAIELLFFDLSSCVSDDSKAAPGPPPSAR
jgi:hypothetical protein